jgi:Domain of unknown function (DUF1857)
VISLHHEHLIRINDPANMAGHWLTREQLWDGLWHTVVTPQSVDTSIDAAAVEEIGPNELSREVRRGHTVFCDRVERIHQNRLTIHADTASAFAGSTLTISIEEPAPGMLFVRFTYQLFGLENDRTEEEDETRRSAYRESDIARIREARRFVAATTKH